MKIERLILENFRGIGKTLNLQLEPDLTVLAGVNGSGKSTILDALAILLSWVVARVRRADESGMPISELSINNLTGYARIRAETCIPKNLNWQLVQTKEGYIQPACATELDMLSQFTKSIQQQISDTQEKCNIPLFVYYPVNRAVQDIRLRSRQSHEFGLLDSWGESLTGNTSFRSFFEWFRNREDLENEIRLRQAIKDALENDPSETALAIAEIASKNLPSKKENWLGKPDLQLKATRHALEKFLPGFENFSVRRLPLQMIVQKNGEEIRIDQLSDGEKCLMVLVGDLARRLAIANPKRENPLEGEGVVLIDEIELHLHPAWQRTILGNLIRTFPNCQFVVSTHSPQVVGEAEPWQVRLLRQDENNEFSYYIPTQAKGLNSNEILDELMSPDSKSLSRNKNTEDKLDNLFRLIHQEKFKDAKTLIAEMKQELHGDIPDIVRAESLIFMLDEDSEA